MRYLVIAACLLCTACKSGGYQMKITYMVNKTEGSHTTIRNQHIVADNDSLAYVKANQIFNQRIEQNDSTKALADHFELYNPKGVLVKRPSP